LLSLRHVLSAVQYLCIKTKGYREIRIERDEAGDIEENFGKECKRNGCYLSENEKIIECISNYRN
jgi:hypothetical protein